MTIESQILQGRPTGGGEAAATFGGVSEQPTTRAADRMPKAFVFDDIVYEAVADYLDEIDPSVTGVAVPEPSAIKQEILRRTNARIGAINDMTAAKGAERMIPLKTLHPVQVAEILTRLHNVALIKSGKYDPKTGGQLGFYVATGRSAGTYCTDETELSDLMRTYCRTMNGAIFADICQRLRECAPAVAQCEDPDLVPVNNGIFDYKSKALLPFTPDTVFISKSEVGFDPDAQSPRITMPDGEVWEVEEWIAGLSDDEGVPELLWQIIGAVVRPCVRWNKSAWLYSEKGNNGKGTFAQLLRNLVGDGRHRSIPVADFASDFLLEELLQGGPIIVDENDVGAYHSKAANLKAVITNDIITINRKNRVAVRYRHWGFMVQCVNEMPQFKDRSDSLARRLLMVPFTKWFGGNGVERKDIKRDYLARPDVLRYVLKRVLLDTPDYYELDEPEACKALLLEQREMNDPVREFWAEFEDLFVWDLLPFTFLYDLFKAWFAKTHPSGHVLASQQFRRSLAALVEGSSRWHAEPRKSVHVGSKMSAPELLILQYDLVDWKRPGYTGKDPRQMCIPSVPVNYRGSLSRI